MKRDLKLGQIVTGVIEKHSLGEKAEGGFFELDVFADKAAFLLSPSKSTLVHRIFAYHLGQAIQDTGVPREYWYAEYDPLIQKELNFPERLKLSA